MPGITGTSRDETGSAGHPRRWFWIGVILLAVGVMALFICLLADLEGADDWAIALLLFVCPFLISGIYCMRRGRKVSAADVQRRSESAVERVRETQQRLGLIKDTESKIIIKMPWWFRVIGWGILLVGLLLFIALLPASLAEPNLEGFVAPSFGLFSILGGIWMVGMTTKVTFHEQLGYMDVSRGNCPLFLWFLRTKRISRDEARSVFVNGHQVRVVARSGKEVKLYDHGEKYGPDEAQYLAKRILDFAQEAEVEFSPGAKFSMRVDEAFQATFASGALGMVVGGTVEQGTIRNGDEVEIRRYQSTKRARVFEVDAPTGFGAAGEKIRLLIEDLTERDVMLGDIVERV